MPDEDDDQNDTTQHASGADEVEVKDWGTCQSVTGSGGPPPEYRWRGHVR